MKFIRSAIALVLAIATTSSADTAVPKDRRNLKKTLDHRMKNGLFDKRTLMKGAKPYSDAAKKQQGLRNLGYDITGAFSVQFQSCFSLTTSYEDMFDNDEGGSVTMAMFQNGNLLAMKSYAIFRLCYNNVCGSSSNEGMLDYVVDLDTYVQALVNYLPEQMEGFCEGCMDNQEACLTILYGGYAGVYANGNQNQYRQQNYNANDNNYNGANVNNVNYAYGNQGYQGNSGYQNGNGGYQNGNGGYQNGNYNQQQQQQAYNNGYYDNGNSYNTADNGNRKLAELHEFEMRVLNDGQVVKQLDCNLCLSYGCLRDDDDGNDGMYGFEAASEWLQDTAECRETGISYSGYGNGYYQNGGGDDDTEMYSGFVCNADGTGVELGLFLDEECILYMPNEAYTNYMSYFDQTYAEMTKEIIEFTFSNAVLSCKEEEYVYTTQNLGNYDMYNYQNWNGDDDDDLNEWCDMLINGDYTPVDISSCGVFGESSYYNNQDYNSQYEQYQQQYGQNDDDNMQYEYMYNWYRYEVTLDNSYDMYSVCSYMKKNSGDLHTFYNSDNGNMYDYSSSNSASESITEFMEGSDNELDFGESSSLYYRAANMNAAEKFGIVAGTGVIVGAAVALYLRFRTLAEDSKEEALIDDDEDVVERSRKGEDA